MNKFVDISRNLFKNNTWNDVLLFWGVTTLKSKSGEYQPFKWYVLDFMVGVMMVYTIGSLELKTIIAASFTAVSLTPRLPVGGYKFKVFIFLQVVKTVGLWWYFTVSSLFVLT